MLLTHCARRTPPARWNKAQHHMVAGSQLFHIGADFYYLTCALMASDDW